jgi:hypothetical protein
MRRDGGGVRFDGDYAADHMVIAGRDVNSIVTAAGPLAGKQGMVMCSSQGITFSPRV